VTAQVKVQRKCIVVGKARRSAQDKHAIALCNRGREGRAGGWPFLPERDALTGVCSDFANCTSRRRLQDAAMDAMTALHEMHRPTAPCSRNLTSSRLA
jgi:hypothetical protein